MNKEQEQIIDEVYEKYSIIAGMSTQVVSLTREEFIHYIKTDVKFSETWGIKIEEHILTFEERHMLWDWEGKEANVSPFMEKQLSSMLDKENIPTKLITLTYKENKIESYE
jgi:hypothetical protein